jgi:hypothetical protein
LTALLNLLLGGSLLLGGRKVFWLLLGSIGFVTGVEVATRFMHRSELVTIGAAITLGVLFALLAIFFESIAIGLAGFLGGGYVALTMANLLSLQGHNVELVAFVLGGVLGIILIVVLFDWALISISSLAGASMVVGGLGLQPGIRANAFAVLVFLGVLIQGLVLRREAAPRRQPTR